MSLSEERIMILKMLEEGKITSEEASRLLEALDSSSRQASSEKDAASKQQRNINFNDEVSKVRDRIHEWRREFKKSYNQKDFDRMVDEFSEKAEKLGKNVAATTFSIVDRVIDFVGSFVDTNAFNIFGNYRVVERSFENPAVEGMDLSIEAVNGHILVKKHLENKIIIKSKVRSPLDNADEILNFSADEKSAALKLNKTGNMSVSHEVFLPALKFNKVRLETSNGKIHVEDSISAEFQSITKNAPIDLMGVKSDTILVNTRNARIQISYVIGKDIDINTNNSVIDLKNIKAETINAVTTNGRILVENVQCSQGSPEINMTLKTSNGGIKVNMNDMDNKAYKVKARASNGGINLLIPELVYHNINKQNMGGSFVEAESNGYNNYPERVNINAEAVNGYVEVVK